MLDDFKPVRKGPQQPKPKVNPNRLRTGEAVDSIPVDDKDFSEIKVEGEPEQPKKHDYPEPDFTVPTKDGASKKKKLFICAAIFSVLALAGASYWYFTKKPSEQTANSTTKDGVVVAEKKKTYSPLTGVELKDASLASRPVTGIMIENSPDSRPQSGLDSAGVVYEAIAEGGVTRFLALYQEDTPNYIGPIRSARPYYVEWVKSYDASYGHVGGSPDALAKIRTLNVKDLDQFSNGNSYYRINTKPAPHNVYTDFTKLDALNEKKGYTTSKFTSWERKIDVPQTPTASTIDLSISGPTYSPRFTYDISTNSYKRIQAGAPHLVSSKDGVKKQINPKVVIALVTDYSLDSDRYHSTYRTTGTGKMFVFQDGIVSTGTWSRKDAKSPYVFTDKYGLPLKLNAGQKWVTVVANSSAVSYKP